jgi:hypothetical protein
MKPATPEEIATTGTSMEGEVTMSGGCEAFPTSLPSSTMEGCSVLMRLTSFCKQLLWRAPTVIQVAHTKECCHRTCSSSLSCLRKEKFSVQSC